MKKLITIIVMAAVLLTACTIENSPVVDQIITINAIIAGDTKVALGIEDEKKVSWTEDDIINLTINEVEYPFTWQEGTTFAYAGGETLPTLTQGMKITAAYANTYDITQTGLKADVGNYMALFAEKTITTEQSYGNLNLTFSHGTSILKLTLSNEDFKGKEVTDIILKANDEVIAVSTATFMGDAENGSVTVYFAIQPSSLENVKIHATCLSKEYTATMTDKTLVSGKIYKASMEVTISNDYYIDEYGINHGKGVEINGVVWAPVNCGYHAEDFKYGKLYQWGRKYGQGYDGKLYDQDGNISGEYSDNILPTLYTGPVDVTTGQSKDNENKFYRGSAGVINWTSSSKNNQLWNLGEDDAPEKTEYDPCPKGWRVPTYGELYALAQHNPSSYKDASGQIGILFSATNTSADSAVSQIFFPASGYRSGDGNGDAYYRDLRGYYWSSKSYVYSIGPYYTVTYYDARYLYFTSNNISLDHSVRANGYSVRCVQE